MNARFKLSLSISLLLLLTPHTVCAQKPELIVQTGHTGPILLIAFSPDGKTLAASGLELKLWDVTTGVELRTLGSNTLASTIAFSPDGKTLASGTGEGKVDWWDVTTGVKLRVLELNESHVNSVAFSPDGKTLAASGGSQIKLWDAMTGLQLRSFEEESGALVLSLAFSPDGKLLASGNSSFSGVKTKINLWDISTSQQIRSFSGQTSDVQAIVFRADGKTLASRSSDRTVKLWDVTTGRELHTFASADDVSAIALSPDGQMFASGTRDGRVELLALATGVKLRALQGRNAIIFSLAFEPGGKTLAVAGMATEVKNNTLDTIGGGEINLWDVATGTPLRALKRHVSGVEAIAFSPDGRLLASACLDGTVKLWDLATGVQLRSFRGHADHTIMFTLSDYSLVFSPDSKTLASASLGETVNLWDITTGKQLRPLAADNRFTDSVAFSPDGKTLAGGGADDTSTGIVKLWDVSTGRLLHALKGHTRLVLSVAFSPDGKTLVSSDKDRIFKQWNVLRGQLLYTAKSRASDVHPTALSPDGKLLASVAYNDKTIELSDFLTGAQLRSLQTHETRAGVVFSPDSKRIVTLGEQAVKLWDISTGTQLRTLEGYPSYITSGAFSRDGQTLALAGTDGTIKLWNTNSGAELASMISIDENDWAVVAPDGLFDSSPAAWNKLLWRAPQNTFDYAPVEAYFSDFYYPGLLADIFAGKAPKAPQDIAQKDRHLPHLQLTLGGQQMPTTTTISTRNITVKLEISNAVAGAQDVRLFRNGILVHVWRGDMLKGQTGATLEATLLIVAGENRLTAYAFNRDSVKSEDATLTIKGADNLTQKGTAYVLAVGINAYANPQYDLKYAVADATDFSAEIKRQQERLGQYGAVVVSTLLDAEATKTNITRQLLEIAKRAQPEDAVFIYFAGHGTAQGKHFYLIPHDLGYLGARAKLDPAGLQAITAHGISDRELAQVFESLDAGQLLVVIDACNSGQALEAEDKRRGPMNSKGLAQLAYEKGMYILTAAQSFQAAQEASQVGHGLLTFALVEEGLKQALADDEPQDGNIIAREWLDYATSRVPQMQVDKMKAARGRGLNLSFKEEERGLNQLKRSGQQPRVFYRREQEAQPLIVAKTGTTKLRQ
jgi:WD40 repeat protein